MTMWIRVLALEAELQRALVLSNELYPRLYPWQERVLRSIFGSQLRPFSAITCY